MTLKAKTNGCTKSKHTTFVSKASSSPSQPHIIDQNVSVYSHSPVVVKPGAVARDDDVVSLFRHVVLAGVHQPVHFSFALLLVILLNRCENIVHVVIRRPTTIKRLGGKKLNTIQLDLGIDNRTMIKRSAVCTSHFVFKLKGFDFSGK